MKDMFRNAIRHGWEEFGKRVEERHLERELDLRLGFWAAEAAVAEVIAQVFGVPVAAADWKTHLSASGVWNGDYQSGVGADCRQSGSSETDVRLEASVSHDPEEGENEREIARLPFGVRLLRDPPAAVFDPVIHDLDAVAAEVMAQIPGSTRSRLRKRFEHAEFDLHIPLTRLAAIEALVPLFRNLPAYEGELFSLRSLLRLDEVPVGTATAAVHAWVHQDPDDCAVSVDIQCHLRSADDRSAVDRRLDRAVELLRLVG